MRPLLSTTPRPLAWTQCLLLAISLGCPGTALAKRKSSAKTTAASPKQTKVTQQRSSSEESTAERDRRLYRECKGLPNAGACLGYTRP